MLHCLCFLSSLSKLFWRNQPLSGSPRSRCSENLGNLSIEGWVIFYLTCHKGLQLFLQWTPLQITIKIFNFQSTYFTESNSITAYDSSARILSNGLCNVVLNADRNWNEFHQKELTLFYMGGKIWPTDFLVCEN